ncbi:fumarylacetoacetate hydrolase family protein [Pseudoclavibacter terrae]|uniref:fumarylacetoacetate hydrolase family protein n=1 Tax=Pseudoclavibacter terrae TaxID=1530195 RepID=UPI00232C5A4A|nr:fumarylacetoacetate hydrolase family protein [Pseudoclavibacter terrae]
MKIISYKQDGEIRGGVIVDGNVFDLERLYSERPEADAGSTRSVRAFLEHYGTRLSSLSKALPHTVASKPEALVGPLDSLQLAAPLTDPSKVLCIGLNYKDHVAETGRALPEYPDVFAKFASTLVGPQDDLKGAELSDNMDFEGEVAVVIGRTARNVTEDNALQYVAGLAPLNDTTARDLQYRGTQWLAGKAVDGSTPWGPALVTLDEVGDPQTLELTTRVNGVEMQRSNTRHQIFSISHIIAYLSSFLTLEPGDVIATGTPQGIGAKRNPPIWLQPGDTIEVEVERLGVLRNTVAAR